MKRKSMIMLLLTLMLVVTIPVRADEIDDQIDVCTDTVTNLVNATSISTAEPIDIAAQITIADAISSIRQQVLDQLSTLWTLLQNNFPLLNIDQLTLAQAQSELIKTQALLVKSLKANIETGRAIERTSELLIIANELQSKYMTWLMMNKPGVNLQTFALIQSKVDSLNADLVQLNTKRSGFMMQASALEGIISLLEARINQLQNPLPPMPGM